MEILGAIPFGMIIWGVPCIVAIFISRHAVSHVAAIIICLTALFILFCVVVGIVAGLDCEFNDLSFRNCRTLPARLEATYSALWLLGAFAFPVLVAPILFVIVVIFEYLARKRTLSKEAAIAPLRPRPRWIIAAIFVLFILPAFTGAMLEMFFD